MWLNSRFKIISALDECSHRDYTVKCLIENENKHEILQVLRRLDLDFSDLKVEEISMNNDLFLLTNPDEIESPILQNDTPKITSVKTAHRKFDEKGNCVAVTFFDLDSHESEGTRKIVALVGPLVDALKQGSVLIMDDIEVGNILIWRWGRRHGQQCCGSKPVGPLPGSMDGTM